MLAETAPVDYERHTLRGWPRRWLRIVVLAFLRLVAGVRLEHPERTPMTGGVIVASNHLHNADPVLINAALPRPLHFMAKKKSSASR